MQRRRHAIVLGGANTVQEDAAGAAVLLQGIELSVFAVNDVGVTWGRIDYFASLHHEKIAGWRRERESLGLPPPREWWTIPDHQPNLPWAKTSPWAWDASFASPCGAAGSGSSGLFACKIALEHGYDRIILCGVPMEPSGNHFFDPAPWTECEGFRNGWTFAMPWLQDTVKSMSGWTRSLLGAPSPEWLRGDEDEKA